MHIHTIPVDTALTPEEAWEEIRLFGRRVTFTTVSGVAVPEHWVNYRCDGDDCLAL